MSQERFDALLERLAAEVGLEDLPDLLHRGLLNVADTDVLITRGPEGSCRLLVDLGPPPDDAGAAFYRRMLERNLHPPTAGQQVLSLEPQSGHVIAIIHASFDALESADGLASLLCERIPELVDAWEDEL